MSVICGNPFIASQVVAACEKGMAECLPLSESKYSHYAIRNRTHSKLESILIVARAVHGKLVYLTGAEFESVSHYYQQGEDNVSTD